MAPVSRRQFLGYAATLPFLLRFHELAAAQRKRVKIRDVQVMMLEGNRTYTLVKITANDGLFGIAEAYGSPGVAVKEQVLALKPWLVGKDPLEIDKLYTLMGSGSPSLSGTRTTAPRTTWCAPSAGSRWRSGISRARSSTCPRRRSSADASATRCASTTTPPRATCSTRRPLRSGRRRRKRTRAGSRATSSGSGAAIRLSTRRATPPIAC